MFAIFLVPIFLSLAVYYYKEKRKKIFYWILAALSLFLAILSGSRGIWLSFLPVALLAIFLLWQKKIERVFVKKTVIGLAIFLILFLVSSFYPLLLYKFESWQKGQSGQFNLESFDFFERAKSISDLTEISNKGRLVIWQMSAKSIFSHPVLGVGLGNYALVLDQDISSAKKRRLGP